MAGDDADRDFEAISEAHHNKISNALTKAGYADGISDGRDSVFQSCFDTGYSDGLLTGLRISALRAFAQHLESSDTQISPELQQELEKFKHTGISKPESREHFQMRQNNTETISEISQQQSKYVATLAEKIRTEFPLMYSFINIK